MCAACDPKWTAPKTIAELLAARATDLQLQMILVQRATDKLIRAARKRDLRRLG